MNPMTLLKGFESFVLIWQFTSHFRQLTPKLVSAAAALEKLLPDVGDPGTSCQRLLLEITPLRINAA